MNNAEISSEGAETTRPEVTILLDNLSEIEFEAKKQHKEAYTKIWQALELPDLEDKVFDDGLVDYSVAEFWRKWNRLQADLVLSALGYDPLTNYQPDHWGHGNSIRFPEQPPSSIYRGRDDIRTAIDVLNSQIDNDDVYVKFGMIIGGGHYAGCTVFGPRWETDWEVMNRVKTRAKTAQYLNRLYEKERRVVSEGCNWTVYRLTNVTELPAR